MIINNWTRLASFICQAREPRQAGALLCRCLVLCAAVEPPGPEPLLRPFAASEEIQAALASPNRPWLL